MRSYLSEMPGAGKTVLVVDDTEVLQEIVSESLRGLGYAVLVAARGDEALRIAAGHDGPIHLLLTDLNMPDMGGAQLAGLLAHSRPGIRVLFMSGSGAQALEDPEVQQAGAAVLEKPFRQVDLAKAVREALDR